MSIIKNDRVKQIAQKPSARIGDNQSPRVKQVEGSLLGSPKKASDTVGKTPHL